MRDDLFELLRGVRLEISKKEAIAPYLIFHDKTLAEMAATKPQSEIEMKDISGVGDKKFEKYGIQFIEAIKGGVQI